MSHFGIDTVKYEQNLALCRSRWAAAEQILIKIGSVDPVIRAVREAAVAGHLPAETGKSIEVMLPIFAQSITNKAGEQESVVNIDQQLLNQVIDHLRQILELMRFGNFLVTPGCRTGEG